MNYPLIKSVVLSLVLITLISCGNTSNQKTEVPEVFAENTEVNEYFETLDKVIDEYIAMSEKIIKTGKKAEKNNEDPSFSDAMEMYSTVTSSILKMDPLLEKMQDLEDKAEILKEDMTSEEIEMFSKNYTKMMQRFYEMSRKIK